MTKKQRLDVLVAARGLLSSREKAKRYIIAGEVLVDGQVTVKPAAQIAPDAEIVLKSRPRFVSRGGEKLAGALEAFPVEVAGKVCADVGASTGGFTDCLLQNGAVRVYAIDVGYGQLAWKLRQDPRVINMERTHARYLESLPEKVDLVTMDASFISSRAILPAIKGWMRPPADLILLIKPQFEAGPENVGKGGVVRDPKTHRRVLEEVLAAAAGMGYHVRGLTASPLRGPAGNVEFLTWFQIGDEEAKDRPAHENLIRDAMRSIPEG